jgi:hypothetical protein
VLSNIIGLVKAPSIKVTRTGISFTSIIGIADKNGSLGLHER